MRVIALIDQKTVIENILRHLGLWSGPQAPGARSPPPDLVYEPWPDNPLPEYENVLTD